MQICRDSIDIVTLHCRLSEGDDQPWPAAESDTDIISNEDRCVVALEAGDGNIVRHETDV